METIFTLSIECVWGIYLKERFFSLVEVQCDMTLGGLHDLLQDLTGFDNDHLFTFFKANSPSGERLGFTESDDWEEEMEQMWQIPLDEVFPLPKHKKLYYLFDYGDNWTFEIRKKRQMGPPAPGVVYPRVIQEEGPMPAQYPSFDEDE